MYSSRKELKARAKQALRVNYWHAFGMTLLTLLIMGIIDSIITIVSGSYNTESYSIARHIAGWILSLITVLFVAIPISTGLTRYFIKSAHDAPYTNNLFHVYKNGLSNTILINIMQNIFVILWSLLLIIPGIIKSYQYSMIGYMLAENPKLDRKRAFELTKKMMNGNKWRLFVLELSFIGWYILSVLTFGIGIIFLLPYVQATNAQFYLELKKNAIDKGIINESELNG